ncbi:Isopenicillin N synthase [Metschnikowia aff. pulcherrima]|uniref:Isopenicillin N synthase n=1 Tax=Metschnikowia aff. pulcherrima TaxID=2163413 RepID=A0A4P6XU86_9ASCO|nr:Isopenicillin N synthase [Metschnikowia aff. pulcherrima]
MSIEIPRISLHDFDARREEIKSQLHAAAVGAGFFVLCNQASPAVADIEKAFETSKHFFDLPTEVKQKLPFQKLLNCGYEYKAQVRPSTGTKDLKESLQLQLHKKDIYWPLPDDVGAEFVESIEQFIEQTQSLSMKVLGCLAECLGFDSDFFSRAHMIKEKDAQSTLRLLHYPDVTGQNFAENEWRAGAHTDFDCLTLLFQRTGDHGLEVCPGRDAHTDFAMGDTWYPVEAKTGDIVVNIGDMLMSWSDDKFKSNFHRVRTPKVGENQSSRYTIAWFNQANENVVIQGPEKKYAPTTGKQYIVDAMKKNFALLQESAASS